MDVENLNYKQLNRENRWSRKLMYSVKENFQKNLQQKTTIWNHEKYLVQSK